MLWLRNNLSTLFSQAIDTALFTYIAFGLEWDFFAWKQLYPTNILWEIGFTAYVLKFLIAFADTPFLYGAVYLKKKYRL